MKFLLFIEGYTERKAVPAFLKRWLDPRLSKPVGITTVRFDGWAELIKDVAQKTAMYLNSPRESKDIIAVIALLDLYGPNIYPDDKASVKDRYEWLKNEIEKKVSSPRFRLFCAVHETEAWLLSDPKVFPTDVATTLKAKVAHPETVNFKTPPAKYLEKLYETNPGRYYGKVADGATLFRKLDPEVAYAKCPYLRAMLDEMLKLAQEAGL
ncbi:MAG TPA: DUF4276 family protein [Chthonomonadaceae bacterium]|nr:DUF4276 family protein [Chthonomonadaceae bacterium]